MFFIYKKHPKNIWAHTDFFKGHTHTIPFNNLWSDYSEAMFFTNEIELQTTLNKIRLAIMLHYDGLVKQFPQDEKKLAERLDDALSDVMTGNLHDIPEPEGWNDSHPIDPDHIPDEDRDVEIIHRFGKREGVVTNFLRQEMLKGHYLGLENKSYLKRWRYIPDSYYLQIHRKSN